jgi:ABC-type uncharacterized transport system substrate-binding protein
MLVRLLLSVVWCWVALAGSAMVRAAELVVVSSDKTPGHVETAQTILAEYTRAYPDRVPPALVYLSESRWHDNEAFKGVRAIVTLGSEALTAAIALDSRTPLVSALIPRNGVERILRESPVRAQAQVSALYLDQPFSRQAELIRQALPKAQRVGVLLGGESMAQEATLQAALQSKGLDMASELVGLPGTLFAGLKTVLDGTDVLLAVPDPKVYNGSTISNVLLATYRARVPVVAFSPAYVRAGALMSLHSTPRQIGLQAFAMVKNQLQGNSGVVLQYPVDFTVVLNEQVARSLDLVLNEQSLTERLKRLERRP